jgi:hypothetical protein
MTNTVPMDLAAEVERLRELVLDQGEEIAGLERRLGAHEAFLSLAGKAAGGEPAAQAPYGQAASVQARRAAMHAVPAAEGVR